MFHVVDVELTPNPHALKFVLNEKILRFESRQFTSVEQAGDDPLAKAIFEIPGIQSIFYMDRFITIEKAPDTDWGMIQRPFVTILARFDKSQLPPEAEPVFSEELSDSLMSSINQVLNTKVRPALAHDGGGLEVLGLTGFTLRVRYQGACGSCPSAINGTLHAIESVLKREVNPAIEVITG
ncbi:MAG: NifU family protein [Ignavibacteria bacterium]|nr:NifU family protein [Ignavibacteria bacterium]